MEFRKGQIFFNSSQYILFPINSFMCLINECFENENEDNIISIFNNCSIDDSIITSKKINKNKILNSININNYLEILNKFGLGEIKLKLIQKNKIIFIVENLILSNYYEKIYSKKPILPIELIFQGILNNHIKYITNHGVTSKFVKDKNKNRLILEFLIENEVIEITTNKKYLIETNFSMNGLIKKILINKFIKNTSGTLKIWNIPIVIVPYFYFIHFFENLGDKYIYFFENLGKIQGRSAVNAQKKIFGIKNEEKLFQEVCKQSELLGGGIIKIISKEPFKYCVENNLFSYYGEFYKKESLNYINTYLLNLVRGVYEESYNLKTKMIIEDNQVILIENKDEKNSFEEEKILYILEMKNIII